MKKEQDLEPDPLVRGTVRIRESGSIPKCHGTGTLVFWVNGAVILGEDPRMDPDPHRDVFIRNNVLWVRDCQQQILWMHIA